jgi:hypothetical protein
MAVFCRDGLSHTACLRCSRHRSPERLGDDREQQLRVWCVLPGQQQRSVSHSKTVASRTIGSVCAALKSVTATSGQRTTAHEVPARHETQWLSCDVPSLDPTRAPQTKTSRRQPRHRTAARDPSPLSASTRCQITVVSYGYHYCRGDSRRQIPWSARRVIARFLASRLSSVASYEATANTLLDGLDVARH